ncbi:MAG: nicotinamide-nucleotide amidase [Clostridiales bacterium]|jgi:nicotinamide-nucleotide amidase|nr:nicotinamide-nucleotide amidase [Clostridiales bacterium]MDK2934265.1 nicotinamide-nucleotide amidase [Clostridiales bacterium]
MNAEIIAVGTELLLGQILNTNAQFLSVELSNLGINVYFQTVVGDNQQRLKETFHTALKRADIVILTGGLGPTKDDLTKEIVAETLGLSLELHKESLDRIKTFFAAMHREMASNNEKQAYLPKGSIVLINNNGTAPGCIIEKDDKIVVMLPGPPKEMKPMFRESVYPYLRKKTSNIIYSRVLRIFGIGESSLEQKLIDIIDNQNNPTVAPYAQEGEVTLRITAKCENEEAAEKLIVPVENEIRNRLGITVYGVGEESLEEVTAKLLMEKEITLATAESCTGGLLAEKITRIPGISKSFITGVVTYSNASKIQLLGVSIDTLNQYGAVSAQTALEMAKGIRERSNTDIGISVTGIAGPGGGSEEKPVGLVYIGMATRQKCWYSELRLIGNREKIRNITTLNALDMIRRYLLSGQ